MKKLTLVLIAALALGTFAAACDDDDGGEVRSTNDTDSGSPSGTEDSGSPSGMEHDGEAKCEKVGTDLEADSEIKVTLSEFIVEPEVTSVDAGTVKFIADNVGGDDHELVIVKADSIEALPTADDGSVDEGPLPAGALIGEIEPFPGQSECEGTFELEAASYVLFCNIVEEEDDGTTESHFAEGMATTFTVQ